MSRALDFWLCPLDVAADQTTRRLQRDGCPEVKRPRVPPAPRGCRADTGRWHSTRNRRAVAHRRRASRARALGRRHSTFLDNNAHIRRTLRPDATAGGGPHSGAVAGRFLPLPLRFLPLALLGGVFGSAVLRRPGSRCETSAAGSKPSGKNCRRSATMRPSRCDPGAWTRRWPRPAIARRLSSASTKSPTAASSGNAFSPASARAL
mmetsp:Transcript_12568/g.43410  ORF Transcript_12568/g.43410 Transcript_12568/m.43410 type:complete len:206 (+) Transcript_12568:905-1522(+)